LSSTPNSVPFSGRASEAISRPPTEAIVAQKISVWKELKILFKLMTKSAESRRIFMLIGFVIGVLVLNVMGEVRMNQWQGAFFRAIEHKDFSEIGKQAGVFVCIMLIMLSFVVSQNWFLERIKIRLREWLTGLLLDDWMKPSRAYRLNMTSEERLNPDQRIQEDVRNFSEMSGDLGIGILRATLMLISFVGVLWVTSRGITLPIGGKQVLIPGYMVWFAMLYAAIGSWMTARVGAPLIRMNEERYTREANFRYSLVRISDNAESISFYSGEKDERKIVNRNLQKVLSTLKTLSFANARLTWIACGHGWLVVILPVLVALPGYMQGKLDFGGLMIVVGAFNQVQLSLRWIVENFSRIADWHATLHRVVTFRDAVATVDVYDSSPETISVVPHKENLLEFDKTSITLLDGKIVIADATAKIYPGERVLLVGESGSGKSTLLRAVGGLWPWGSGTISVPAQEDMMFLPQKPYIPLGSLAAAIAYPNATQNWNYELMKTCLRRVNLEPFTEMLDEDARWDKLMSLGQQQRLAFARLLYHKPKWIFLDEATSALDDENQHCVMSLFTTELSASALLSIGHRKGLEEYHTRSLHLIQTHSGRMLTRKVKPMPPNAAKNPFVEEFGQALKKTRAMIARQV
jgi:putative ATP-binding cassette transporter